MTKLSEHFSLSEFLPAGVAEGDVPGHIVDNLRTLCQTVLEPVREHFGSPVWIHSGYRPPDKNAAAGGAIHSDHLEGRAADFHVTTDGKEPWEERTLKAFDWIRTTLDGAYGQLILEDQRKHFGLPGKLWVHVAIPGPLHGGFAGDPNRVLVSPAPHQYEVWKEQVA